MLLGACSLSEWPEAWAELQRSSAALRRRVVGQKEVAEREMPRFRRHALAVLAGKGRPWWGWVGAPRHHGAGRATGHLRPPALRTSGGLKGASGV